jgi:hypothetical protein
MRVNIYAEEMTDRIEIIHKTIDGQDFTGLRFYLELPVTVNGGRTHRSAEGAEVYPPVNGKTAQVRGPTTRARSPSGARPICAWRCGSRWQRSTRTTRTGRRGLQSAGGPLRMRFLRVPRAWVERALTSADRRPVVGGKTIFGQKLPR